MKKIIFLLYLVPVSCFAQSFKLDPDTPPNERKVPYCMIDTIAQSGNTKAQLYSNARAYISTSPKDHKSGILSSDPELGEIAFTGYTSKNINITRKGKHGKEITTNEDASVYFKCRLYLKDNKFKIILGGLEYPFAQIRGSGVFMPVTLDASSNEDNKAALDVAMTFIKELTTRLNRKPDNDF